jgi:hypothetical protein
MNIKLVSFMDDADHKAIDIVAKAFTDVGLQPEFESLANHPIVKSLAVAFRESPWILSVGDEQWNILAYCKAEVDKLKAELKLVKSRLPAE